jgi:hypothetical protein
LRTRSCAERGRAAVAPRPWFACLLAAGIVGCEVRERPTPLEPDTDARLTVEVLSPRDGATIVAGRALTVRVRGRDLQGNGVEALGYVVRRNGGGGTTIDSVSIELDTRVADATEDFTFAVPAILPTNTQLEVFGLAFGSGTAARISVPRAVVVARCEAFQSCG